MLAKTLSRLRSDGAAGLIEAIGRRVWPQRPACWPALRTAVAGRRGLEIGGPSSVFANHSLLPIYPIAAAIDNCNFAGTTVWEGTITEGLTYTYDPRRPPGRQYIAEAVDLHAIGDGQYEFVLSSHTLEHIANPLRALREWRRVLADGGSLVLILPDGAGTFDRQRPVTTMAHLLDDFARQIGEDDLTHLPEILALHDLSRDPEAGDREAFKARSTRNVENRCLHHHVFDAALAGAMLEWLGMRAVAVERAAPYHIVAVATT
jgi:SAM-dependent methyltransferase